MSLIEQIIARAKSNKQRIVLPEAEEERTLRAADRVMEFTQFIVHSQNRLLSKF